MKLSKGFTLIELLIVIGVLGILASGLLAAVDPFEQLKKARDANNRNAAVETLNALTRYYATHGVLPWYSTAKDCDNGVFDDLRTTPLKVVKMSNTVTDKVVEVNSCITNSLISDGELKSGFFSGLATTFYISSGSKTTVIVCYSPEGKALRNDTTATAWSLTGAQTDTLQNSCDDVNDRPVGNCLQCFQ